MDGQTFRDAMALVAAPVTVVTTLDAAGRRRGFTASSISAASANPPLVMVGLARSSSCFDALVAAPEFTVNVLAEHHRQVATRFATKDLDRFAGIDFGTWPDSSLPYLPDASVLLRCSHHEVHPAGDHVLLLGAVRDVRMDPERRALLWYRRQFNHPE